ncbi:MAG: hypothetical protein JNK82_03215 [Myxococcaceae bacterium]|nr:hypothetical protein [Myxococcaceae bacterium]
MSSSLFGLVGLVPFMAVWVVAAVVAATRWSRHPVVSALVVTSAAIHALTMVAQVVLPMRLIDRGGSAMSMGLVSAGIGLVGMVGSVCLIVAAFIGRQESGSPAVSRLF